MYKLELNLELIKTNFKKSFEGLLTSQRFRVSRVFLSFFLFSILYHARIAHTSNNPRVFFNPYSPSMEFFYKILLSEEVFNKIEMNIYGFIFEKKKQIWSKNPKISFRQLTLTEGGYRFF